MALTMELFTTQGGRGGQMGQSVFVCVRARARTCAPCSQEWMKGNDGIIEARRDWEKRRKKRGTEGGVLSAAC